MPGAISQMQMVYNPEEDRILFRVNTTSKQQFRFWVTRRYASLLLRVLSEQVNADPDVSLQPTQEAKQAVRSFKQEEAIKSANFKEKFAEDANELPLGQEIPVAFRLSYNVKDGVLNLGIQPKEGQGINLAINQEINSSLTQLLLSAARKGDWKLDGASTGSVRVSEDNIVIN